MPVVHWDELTSDEQHAFERVASGDTSMVTRAIITRLKELGSPRLDPTVMSVSAKRV